EAHMVPRAEQRSELGSDAYFGGAVFARHAALDPALFHQGLLDRAAADGDGFRVVTARGTVRARDVVIATNGYTGGITPWFRRRVIPIGSYIIATELLTPELMAKLMPQNPVVRGN